MSYLWAFITLIGLYALRNIIALPFAMVFHALGMQNATDKARRLVGGTGETIFLLSSVLFLYILWHVGVLGVLGEALGVIFSNLFGIIKLLPAIVIELLA